MTSHPARYTLRLPPKWELNFGAPGYRPTALETAQAVGEFMAEQPVGQSMWCRTRVIDVLVRVSEEPAVGLGMRKKYNVVNVDVHDGHKSQGVFTRVLDVLERHGTVTVHQILEPRLVPFLSGRGYQFEDGRGPKDIATTMTRRLQEWRAN